MTLLRGDGFHHIDIFIYIYVYIQYINTYMLILVIMSLVCCNISVVMEPFYIYDSSWKQEWHFKYIYIYIQYLYLPWYPIIVSE